MKKWIAVAVLALAVVTARAQAPVTHTFTLNPYPILTTAPGDSYYTYVLTTFDNVGYVVADGYKEVDHLAMTMDSAEKFDFLFSVASYTGCSQASENVSSIPTSGGKTVTTTANVSCSGATIQTVAAIDYQAVSCGGRGSGYLRKCYREVKRYPISGTMTE